MKIKKAILFSAFVAAAGLFMAACSGKGNEAKAENIQPIVMNTDSIAKEIPGPVVEIKTSKGDIIVKLYNDTPLHRDNFLKLVKDGFYEGLLFHRVINNFMVQAGDPDSKDAAPGRQLGAGNPGYTIEAEIDYPNHYHKYGALAAARTGDAANPERRSSGSQFYIVTGQKVPASQLQSLASRSVMPQRQAMLNRLAASYADSIRAMQAAGDREGLMNLQNELIARVEKEIPDQPLDEKVAADYTTVGGAPHLDGQYTVFGEVLKGMDVVEKIQNVETDRNDRPVEDIKILSVKILEE